MGEKKFNIEIQDKGWLKDSDGDLCLHGKVKVSINDNIILDEYECTISSTGLYLLKSLHRNHIIGKMTNQLFPHCGFFYVHDEGNYDIDIIGCNIGVDLDIIHIDSKVKISTENGIYTVIDYRDYEKIVFDFVDEVIDYYNKSPKRILPADEYDKEGYFKFWDMINKLRNKELNFGK